MVRDQDFLHHPLPHPIGAHTTGTSAATALTRWVLGLQKYWTSMSPLGGGGG